MPICLVLFRLQPSNLPNNTTAKKKKKDVISREDMVIIFMGTTHILIPQMLHHLTEKQ